MGAHETRTFKSGNSVALRLPRDLGFGAGEQVTIERRGRALLIRPVDDPVEARRKLQELLADLAAMGRPGDVQLREPIEFPDRPGLY